jgi:aminoglycoside 6'-N-acetyltransferase I
MAEALIDNHESHALHRALGFAETERVVFFRRALP